MNILRLLNCSFWLLFSFSLLSGCSVGRRAPINPHAEKVVGSKAESVSATESSFAQNASLKQVVDQFESQLASANFDDSYRKRFWTIAADLVSDINKKKLSGLSNELNVLRKFLKNNCQFDEKNNVFDPCVIYPVIAKNSYLSYLSWYLAKTSTSTNEKEYFVRLGLAIGTYAMNRELQLEILRQPIVDNKPIISQLILQSLMSNKVQYTKDIASFLDPKKAAHMYLAQDSFLYASFADMVSGLPNQNEWLAKTLIAFKEQYVSKFLNEKMITSYFPAWRQSVLEVKEKIAFTRNLKSALISAILEGKMPLEHLRVISENQNWNIKEYSACLLATIQIQLLMRAMKTHQELATYVNQQINDNPAKFQERVNLRVSELNAEYWFSFFTTVGKLTEQLEYLTKNLNADDLQIVNRDLIWLREVKAEAATLVSAPTLWAIGVVVLDPRLPMDFSFDTKLTSKLNKYAFFNELILGQVNPKFDAVQIDRTLTQNQIFKGFQLALQLGVFDYYRLPLEKVLNTIFKHVLEPNAKVLTEVTKSIRSYAFIGLSSSSIESADIQKHFGMCSKIAELRCNQDDFSNLSICRERPQWLQKYKQQFSPVRLSGDEMKNLAYLGVFGRSDPIPEDKQILDIASYFFQLPDPSQIGSKSMDRAVEFVRYDYMPRLRILDIFRKIVIEHFKILKLKNHEASMQKLFSHQKVVFEKPVVSFYDTILSLTFKLGSCQDLMVKHELKIRQELIEYEQKFLLWLTTQVDQIKSQGSVEEGFLKLNQQIDVIQLYDRLGKKADFKEVLGDRDLSLRLIKNWVDADGFLYDEQQFFWRMKAFLEVGWPDAGLESLAPGLVEVFPKGIRGLKLRFPFKLGTSEFQSNPISFSTGNFINSWFQASNFQYLFVSRARTLSRIFKEKHILVSKNVAENLMSEGQAFKYCDDSFDSSSACIVMKAESLVDMGLEIASLFQINEQEAKILRLMSINGRHRAPSDLNQFYFLADTLTFDEAVATYSHLDHLAEDISQPLIPYSFSAIMHAAEQVALQRREDVVATLVNFARDCDNRVPDFIGFYPGAAAAVSDYYQDSYNVEFDRTDAFLTAADLKQKQDLSTNRNLKLWLEVKDDQVATNVDYLTKIVVDKIKYNRAFLDKETNEFYSNKRTCK